MDGADLIVERLREGSKKAKAQQNSYPYWNESSNR